MAGNAQLVRALLASLSVHAAVGGGAAWLWQLAGRKSPPQAVLVARLVRKGPPRDKALLPQRTEPPAPPPSPPEAAPPAAVPPAPAPPAARAPAAPRAPRPPPARHRPAASGPSAGARAALERLKHAQSGQADGSAEGDADEAAIGDAYAAEIYRCVKANYVIEGVEAAQVAGSRALVTVYVQSDGRILRHKLQETSGQPAFDQAVSRAVQRCGRVSPPPDVWRERLRTDGLEIEFQP